MTNLTVGKSFLKFIDSNDNKKLDEGELAYFETNGKKQYFRCTGQQDNFYFLDYNLTKFKSNKDTPYVFSPEYGFLAKNMDSANRPFVVTTGSQPLDRAGFGMLTGAMIGMNADVFKTLPTVEDLQIALVYDNTSARKFHETLDDSLMLKRMGYDSLDDFKSKVHIYTEGELATGPANRIHRETTSILSLDTVMGVSWHKGPDGKKPVIALNGTFLRKAYHPSHKPDTQKKWQNAVRSVVYHEGHHIRDQYSSNEALKPSSTYREPIYRLVGAVLDERSDGKEMGPEIFNLFKNNHTYKGIYNSYFPYIKDGPKTNRAVFLNAFQEGKAYIDQLSYISEVGLDNFPPDFLEDLKEAAVHYLDICAAMLSLPGGEVCVQALLEPLSSGHQDVKNFFFKDWDRYSDYYGKRLETLKPYL